MGVGGSVSVANAAHAIATPWVAVCVLWTVGMTEGAGINLFRMEPTMFGLGDRLQVRGIDTAAIAADVMQLLSRGDRADHRFVDRHMRAVATSADPDGSIPRGGAAE